MTAGPLPIPVAGDADHVEVARRVPLVRTGDAFDLIRDVPDSSVDLILTSPPYWGLRTYGHDHNPEVLDAWRATGDTGVPAYGWYRRHGGVFGLEPYPEWYLAHLAEFFALAEPKLRQSGSVWLNIGDTYFGRWSSIRADGRHGLSGGSRERRRTPSGGYLHDKQLLLIPARAAIRLQDDGWILRNDVIWSKTQFVPRPEKDRLRNTHEHFFHFVKRRKDGRPAYFYDLSEAEPNGIDVISHKAGRSRHGHTATFPPGLIEPRIRSSCPPGGLVLDPFCGTGRTLEVAVAAGRLAQGFELSKSYAAAARANVRAARMAQQQIIPGV